MYLSTEQRKEFAELLGKTLVDISIDGHVHEGELGDEIHFKTLDGLKYKLFHKQDCCESVYIESVDGDLGDLIGSPLLMAEEVSEVAEEVCESGTWTFYKLATVKGYVTIRWIGESNGYYSESVDFVRVIEK